MYTVDETVKGIYIKIYQTKNYQIKHMVFESDLRLHKQ